MLGISVVDDSFEKLKRYSECPMLVQMLVDTDELDDISEIFDPTPTENVTN